MKIFVDKNPTPHLHTFLRPFLGHTHFVLGCVYYYTQPRTMDDEDFRRPEPHLHAFLLKPFLGHTHFHL
jgi:hypothetical protein